VQAPERQGAEPRSRAGTNLAFGETNRPKINHHPEKLLLRSSLLGDPMLNNCGPSGSPANAATMTGIIQASGVMAVIYGDDAPCGLCGKTNPLEAGAEAQTAIATMFERVQKALDVQKQQILQRSKLAKEKNQKERLLDQLKEKNTEESRRKGAKPQTERGTGKITRRDFCLGQANQHP